MSASLANGLLLLAGMAWGLGFVAQSSAMDDIGPLLFVGVRFVIAAGVMLPFAWWQYRKYAKRAPEISGMDYAKAIMVVGMLFFLGMALQQVGLVYTTVTKAGFLTALYVILVPFLLHFFAKRPQNPWVWPCALLALAGVYLLNDTQISAFNVGDWLVILCSVFWSLHVMYVGRIGRRAFSSIVIACGQFGVAGVFGLSLHFLLHPILASEPMLDWGRLAQAWPELMYTALFAGVFAFSLQVVAQRHTSESNAAVLLSTEALFAALFAMMLLGELGSLQIYVGCALLFSSIVLVQLIPASKA